MSAGRPARLAIGVVSAGRVGAVMGAALAAAGHRVVAASGVSRASVRRAAALLPGVPLVPPDEVGRRWRTSSCSPCPTTSSQASSAVSRRPGASARARSSCTPRARTGVAVLAPRRRARRAAARPAPGDDVHGPRRGRRPAARGERRRSRRAPATRRRGSVGEALVVEMGAEPVRIPEEVRPLYHAALAHGANHLVTLVRDCVDTLEARGRPPRRPARRAAAVGRAGQRAAPRRPRAHRPGVARRRGHRPRRTCASSTPSTPTWPPPTGSWPSAPPTARSGGGSAARARRRTTCSPPSRRTP